MGGLDFKSKESKFSNEATLKKLYCKITTKTTSIFQPLQYKKKDRNYFDFNCGEIKTYYLTKKKVACHQNVMYLLLILVVTKNNA